MVLDYRKAYAEAPPLYLAAEVELCLAVYAKYLLLKQQIVKPWSAMPERWLRGRKLRVPTFAGNEQEPFPPEKGLDMTTLPC